MASHTTPLHGVHDEAGAAFTDFAGWQMPVRYSSDLAEHHAVRESAGLFDLSHMAEIRVKGPDAGAAAPASSKSNTGLIPATDVAGVVPSDARLAIEPGSSTLRPELAREGSASESSPSSPSPSPSPSPSFASVRYCT